MWLFILEVDPSDEAFRISKLRIDRSSHFFYVLNEAGKSIIGRGNEKLKNIIFVRISNRRKKNNFNLKINVHFATFNAAFYN